MESAVPKARPRPLLSSSTMTTFSQGAARIFTNGKYSPKNWVKTVGLLSPKSQVKNVGPLETSVKFQCLKN